MNDNELDSDVISQVILPLLVGNIFVKNDGSPEILLFIYKDHGTAVRAYREVKNGFLDIKGCYFIDANLTHFDKTLNIKYVFIGKHSLERIRGMYISGFTYNHLNTDINNWIMSDMITMETLASANLKN